MNRTARILAIILTVVLVGVGIYVAYESGFENGAISAAVHEDGTSTVVVANRGWGHRGYGFFPFFWIFPLLFFFLIFSAIRRRGPWGGGGWGPPGDWGSRHEYIEGRFREMHDRAHQAPEAPPGQ